MNLGRAAQRLKRRLGKSSAPLTWRLSDGDAQGGSFNITKQLIKFETPCDVSYNPVVNFWHLLQSGSGEAAFNMAMDEALLEAVSRLGRPVLRFYGWMDPAATFGYFQKYADVERATLLRPLIRRPTGGGIVPHDADWTYSFVVPPNHEWHLLKAEESYRRVHDWLRLAFAELKVKTELAPSRRQSAIGNRQSAIPSACFAGHEKFDLLWRGKKIAGAAQRRNKLGLLIQGSVQPPPLSLSRAEWENAMRSVAEEHFSATYGFRAGRGAGQTCGKTGAGKILAVVLQSKAVIGSISLNRLICLMKNFFALLAALAAGLFTADTARAQILISGGTYSQNFDSLADSGTANTWTDNSTLPGWYASRQNTPNAITTYRVDNGSGNAGALYSYGVSSSANRALGCLVSGTPGNIAFGLRFTNDTASVQSNILISFTAEQWRNANTLAQTLAFFYQTGTALTNSDGTNALAWNSFSALNFTTPVTGGSGTALDGTAPANQTVFPNVPLWSRGSAGTRIIPALVFHPSGIRQQSRRRH